MGEMVPLSTNACTQVLDSIRTFWTFSSALVTIDGEAISHDICCRARLRRIKISVG